MPASGQESSHVAAKSAGRPRMLWLHVADAALVNWTGGMEMFFGFVQLHTAGIASCCRTAGEEALLHHLSFRQRR